MTDATPGEPDAYERGRKAGKIDEELAHHGRRLDNINGSIERVAERLSLIVSEFASVHLELQQIKDQMIANEATVDKTAKALKDKAESERMATDKRWSPWQKLFVVLGVLAAFTGIAVALLAR